MNKDSGDNHIFNKYILLTLWLPFAALTYYLWQTTPLMIPGSDVWVHLVQIEHSGGRAWHKVWRWIMDTLGIVDLLYLANLIHKVQSIISFVLIFFSARLILCVVFYSSKPTTTVLNLFSWLAVVFWTIMHGFFAGPIFAAWFVVFANNYQIAYPTYFFGMACVIYGVHLYATQHNIVVAAFYLLTALVCVAFTAIIHASELPYFIIASTLLMIVFFRLKYVPIYFGLTAMCAFFIYYFFDKISGRQPALFTLMGQVGYTDLLPAISKTGAETLATDYGFNTFNYFFGFAFLSIMALFFLIPNAQDSKLNKKLVLFVLLSSTPALMYLTNFGAGLMGMITYPTLAYRFTWSTFLFIAPSILSIYLLNVNNRLKWAAYALPIVALITIPILSYNFERQKVSYNYVKSLVKTLEPNSTRAGMSQEQHNWLDNTYNTLKKQTIDKPICIDIYTAHYLYFQKRFTDVIITPRYYGFSTQEIDWDSIRACQHPVNGGEVFKELGISRGPWSYRAW